MANYTNSLARGLNEKFGERPNVLDFLTSRKAQGRTVVDAAMTNTSAVLTSATGAFTSGMVGWLVMVEAAGASGGYLLTTIATYTSATQVTLAAVASATVSAKIAKFGPNNITDLQEAVDSVHARGGGCLELAIGSYNINAKVTVPRDVTLRGHGVDCSEIVCHAATAAIVYADTDGTTKYRKGGLRDLTIYGPGITTACVGMYLGGDPAASISPSASYADHLRHEHVKITNCGVGIKYANNAFLNTFLSFNVTGNGTAFLAATSGGGTPIVNAGENMAFWHTVFGNNTKPLQLDNAFGDHYFHGCSFDFNNGASTGDWFIAEFLSCHFEQNSGLFIDASASTSAYIRISGGQVLLNASSGTTAAFFDVGGANSSLWAEGIDLFANTGHTVTQAFNFTATGSEKSLYIGPMKKWNANTTISAVTNTLTDWNYKYVVTNRFDGTTGGVAEIGPSVKFLTGIQVRVDGAGTGINTAHLYNLQDATNRNKYIRVGSGGGIFGKLQVLNSAFSAVIWELLDQGDMWLTGAAAASRTDVGVYGKAAIRFQQAVGDQAEANSLQIGSNLDIYGKGTTASSRQIRLWDCVGIGYDGVTAYGGGVLSILTWLSIGTTTRTSGYSFEVNGKSKLFDKLRLDNLTASRALYLDASKDIAVSAVTDTELGYLASVTSAIQTQINGKAPTAHSHNSSETIGQSGGFQMLTDLVGGKVTLNFTNGLLTSFSVP